MMTRYAFHLHRAKLTTLAPGAVIETATLGNYGTTTEHEQEETIVKANDLAVWTNLGNRYSRRTGERWGDGGSHWPRCIVHIVKAAPKDHPVLVKMERVGRRRDVEFTVDWTNPDDFETLLDAIGNRIQPMLMSSGFVLTATDDGALFIEGGRYGTGTWERVPTHDGLVTEES